MRLRRRIGEFRDGEVGKPGPCTRRRPSVRARAVGRNECDALRSEFGRRRRTVVSKRICSGACHAAELSLERGVGVVHGAPVAEPSALDFANRLSVRICSPPKPTGFSVGSRRLASLIASTKPSLTGAPFSSLSMAFELDDRELDAKRHFHEIRVTIRKCVFAHKVLVHPVCGLVRVLAAARGQP